MRLIEGGLSLNQPGDEVTIYAGNGVLLKLIYRHGQLLIYNQMDDTYQLVIATPQGFSAGDVHDQPTVPLEVIATVPYPDLGR